MTVKPWAIEKCQCGSHHCTYYGVSGGVFYQGTGFDLETARMVAEALGMLRSLRELEPFLDAIIDYASTMDEHEPNRIAGDVTAILERLRGIEL